MQINRASHLELHPILNIYYVFLIFQKLELNKTLEVSKISLSNLCFLSTWHSLESSDKVIWIKEFSNSDCYVDVSVGGCFDY